MVRSGWLIALIGYFAAGSYSPAQTDSVQIQQQAARRYGSVRVQKVHGLGQQGQIICDIEGWPAIVGKEMPVQIRGIEMENGQRLGPSVRTFILDTLRAELQERTKDASDPNQTPGEKVGVVLRDIERGGSFCLVADVEAGGRDLGQMLVEQGYARRVLRMAGAVVQAPAGNSSAQAVKGVQSAAVVGGLSDEQVQYAGSKNSKVFHKSSCPHARRMQPESMVTFSSRQDALDSGRRPCKTCNP